jgi:hypothetical protein
MSEHFPYALALLDGATEVRISSDRKGAIQQLIADSRSDLGTCPDL